MHFSLVTFEESCEDADTDAIMPYLAFVMHGGIITHIYVLMIPV